MTHEPSTRLAARELFRLGAQPVEVAKLLSVPLSTAQSWKTRGLPAGRKLKRIEVRHV